MKYLTLLLAFWSCCLAYGKDATFSEVEKVLKPLQEELGKNDLKVEQIEKLEALNKDAVGVWNRLHPESRNYDSLTSAIEKSESRIREIRLKHHLQSSDEWDLSECLYASHNVGELNLEKKLKGQGSDGEYISPKGKFSGNFLLKDKNIFYKVKYPGKNGYTFLEIDFGAQKKALLSTHLGRFNNEDLIDVVGATPKEQLEQNFVRVRAERVPEREAAEQIRQEFSSYFPQYVKRMERIRDLIRQTSSGNQDFKYELDKQQRFTKECKSVASPKQIETIIKILGESGVVVEAPSKTAE